MLVVIRWKSYKSEYGGKILSNPSYKTIIKINMERV